MSSPRRAYLLTLALGAAGAGLVLASARQGWAEVITPAPAPLPAGSVTVTGQDLVPAAFALGIVSLAGQAAVIATRRLARRLAGVLLAACGAVTATALALPVTSAQVLAAGHVAVMSRADAAASGGGSTLSPGAGTAGRIAGAGAAGHVVMSAFPWRAVAVLGALAVAAGGLLVAWQGPRWPVMSSRYDQPGSDAPGPATDSASMWDSLTRGLDPTAGPGRPGATLAGGPASRPVPPGGRRLARLVYVWHALPGRGESSGGGR